MTSQSSTSNHKPRRRQAKKNGAATVDSDPMNPRAVATSLESIEIVPRTPRTPATARRPHGHGGRTPDDVDEVELSLLGEEERRAAAADMTVEEEQEYLAQADGKRPFSARDKQAVVLLIILCAYCLVDTDALRTDASPYIRPDSRIPSECGYVQFPMCPDSKRVRS